MKTIKIRIAESDYGSGELDRWYEAGNSVPEIELPLALVEKWRFAREQLASAEQELEELAGPQIAAATAERRRLERIEIEAQAKQLKENMENWIPGNPVEDRIVAALKDKGIKF